jgi:PAS domain S-box-containing protein
MKKPVTRQSKNRKELAEMLASLSAELEETRAMLAAENAVRRRVEAMLGEQESAAFQIIAEAALHSTDIADLCRRIISGLVKELGFDFGVVRLFDETKQVLDPMATFGLTEEEVTTLIHPQRFDDAHRLAALVARTGEAIFAPDVRTHEIMRSYSARILELGAYSMITWPIKNSRQEVRGIINLMARSPREIPEKKRVFFETLARMFSIVLERRQMEKALREREEIFRLDFEQAPHGRCLASLDGHFLKANNAFCQMIGYSESELRSMTYGDITHPDDVAASHKWVRNVQNGATETPTLEKRYLHKAGHVIWGSLLTILLHNADGTPLYFSTHILDITERKRAEEALEASEMRIRQFVDFLPQVVWESDIEGKLTFANQNAFDIFGYSREDFDAGLNIFQMIAPEDLQRVIDDLKKVFSGEGRIEAEYKARKKDGTLFPIAVYTNSILIAGTGEPRGARGILIDITERKEAEQRLKASLKEKEVLLKEIHHRVKNNMQVISSLLNMQAAHFKDPSLRDAFNEARGRVKSMALIHEKLYQAASLSHLNFGDYLKDTTAAISRSFGKSTISCVVDAEEVSLSIENAIPLGLIVHELLSNAFKHAFPGERKGVIHLSLTWSPAGTIQLTVRDDGIGVPGDLDFRKSPTLGLQLVNDLVDQIEGTIELQGGEGTWFAITFQQNLHRNGGEDAQHPSSTTPSP